MSGYEPGDRSIFQSRSFLMTFAIGIAVIAVAVAGILYMQRGSHIELKGAILKVRTMGIEPNIPKNEAPQDAQAASIAVVDFRFANPGNFPFVVRTVDVTVTGPDGKTYESTVISDVDAKRMFDYYPILGQKFNPSLLTRDKIKPQSTEDRMIAVRFEIPVAQLDARKNLKIRIEDVDGPVSELVETPAK